MSGQLNKLISDVSVLRRMLFAVSHVPSTRLSSTVGYHIAVEFGSGQEAVRNLVSYSCSGTCFV